MLFYRSTFFKYNVLFNRMQNKMGDQEDKLVLGGLVINRRLLPVKLFYFFMMAGVYGKSSKP